jgi:hypothetical protein
MPRGTIVNSERYRGLSERLRKTYDENGWEILRKVLCCIMTNLNVTFFVVHQFWANKQLPCVLIHHICQTWHYVISGYSQKLN